MTRATNNFPEHVGCWEASGLSIAAYCKEYEFYKQTFNYHALCIKKKETVVADGNGFMQI